MCARPRVCENVRALSSMSVYNMYVSINKYVSINTHVCEYKCEYKKERTKVPIMNATVFFLFNNYIGQHLCVCSRAFYVRVRATVSVCECACLYVLPCLWALCMRGRNHICVQWRSCSFAARVGP